VASPRGMKEPSPLLFSRSELVRVFWFMAHGSVLASRSMEYGGVNEKFR